MVLKQSLQMLSTIFIIKRCQIVVNKQSAIEPDKIPLQVALDITCIEPLCAPLNHVNWLSNLYHNLSLFFPFFLIQIEKGSITEGDQKTTSTRRTHPIYLSFSNMDIMNPGRV